jgi:peroxiredoxin
MKRFVFSMLAAVAVMAAAGFAAAGHHDGHSHEHAAIDKKAPNFKLTDVDGKEHSLANYKGRYVVLEWTNMDCPFVKAHYEGNMQKLQKEYAKKGVTWLRICSSAPGTQGYFDAKTIKARIKDAKAMQTAYLIDEDGTVGRMYGAKTTPHMFVIDPEGVLIYAGGIDDTKTTNANMIQKSKNYVSACLDAAMSGKPIGTKTSVPYGCGIKYAKTENKSKAMDS